MLNWLYVDLNSYFASVEQELQPSLRKKPIAVLPLMAETTCCIAASYEARKFGVKTGTLVSEARRLCPGIAFVEARHEKYVEYHEKIVQAVESCLPVTSVMSIDEMACRLTGRDQQVENAVLLGKEVKKKILRVGSQLTSSVGLATNRLLAKIAADMQKPDGLTVLLKEDLPEKLFSLQPRDIPGIGSRMEVRLKKYGIVTMEQLFSVDALTLKAIWGGIGGERFYRWMRGEDFVLETGQHGSIGHSHVLSPELRSEAGSHAVLQKLLQKAAVRLRKIDHWAGKMQISLRSTQREHWSQDSKMLECQDTLTLMEVAESIWSKKPKAFVPMKVSITLLDLISSSDRTFSFFDSEKRIKLSKAMDEINAKFGKSTVYFAGVQFVKAAAPTRIAFQNIPEFDV